MDRVVEKLLGSILPRYFVINCTRLNPANEVQAPDSDSDMLATHVLKPNP